MEELINKIKTRKDLENLLEEECPWRFGGQRVQFFNGASAMFNLMVDTYKKTNTLNK